MRVEAVNQATGQVAFVDQQGFRRVAMPRDASLADFARRLNPGDEVDVTFVQALAVGIEPAGR